MQSKLIFLSVLFTIRNRHTADGKYIAKLSLHELQLFSEQVNALPCVIKEAQLIKVSTKIKENIAFLDASKTWVLFKKLIARCVPIYLVKVLYYWYQNQSMYVKWGQQCQVNFMLQMVFVRVVYYLLFYLMCMSMTLVNLK